MMRNRIRLHGLGWRLRTSLVAVAVVVSAALTAGAASAVVVVAAPTWPIPTDAPLGPLPNLPSLPAAGATPPPGDQIADPVTPFATCGGWQPQTNYANLWSTGSRWWEYQCAAETIYSVTQHCSAACDAFCTYCYVETRDWTDHFYWDGSGAQAVFYGEAYSDSTETADGEVYPSDAWWDAPTKQWYSLGPFPLAVSIAGAGSGNVNRSPAGTTCSDCTANFDAGRVVTLTATPDAGSVFAGWSGDCSGTGSCQVTMNQARSMTATFAPNSFMLTVSKQGTGSGQVSSSPHGITCGAGCQASFDTGAVVTLTATPDPGSVFAGWSGDCSGTVSCQVTISQARSVTATFAPNMPPHASFTLTCNGLNCTFDGGGSSDPDDGIASYGWNFGDGTPPGSSQTTPHTYPKAGSYTVTLTVTDNAGATGTVAKAFNPISVSAHGYRQNGAQRVDLSWNGASGTSFDVYRNGNRIATLQALSYTDTPVGKGSFSYKVCAPGNSVCSNTASVSF
jgi:PKD repeat protein